MTEISHRMESASKNLEVFSFDLFDTLLTRRSGMPETVFDLMQSQWLRRFGCPAPVAFASVRGGAEARAQRWLKRDTVSMAEIYKDVRFFIGGEQPSDEEIMDFEMDVERSVLQPSEHGRKLLCEARTSGKSVIFLSDTYLSEQFLVSVLRNFGLMEETDRLYASSERMASKASGALYRLVQDDLRLPASSFFHIGNSEKVDVLQARKSGWKAERLKTADWTLRELTLWHLANIGTSLSRKVHAAARNSRLETEVVCTNDPEKTAVSIGSAVAGPIFLAFAQWVLEQAKARKIDELFFLSRDAQVIFEICRVLSRASGECIPALTYVYGSRQVWAFHALKSLPESRQAEFFADSLAVAAVSLEECAAILDLAGFPEIQNLIEREPKASRDGVSRGQRIRFYQSITEDSVLRKILSEKLEERERTYIEYLRELPVTSGSSCGIVDIGWSGMWTEIVGTMFLEAGASSVEGFQMGRFKKTSPKWNAPISCFLFDETQRTGLPATPKWLVPLLEAFSGADHGRIVRVERKNGASVPIESPSKCGGLPENVFRAFRSGIMGFAGAWCSLAGAKAEAIGRRSALVEICREFWQYPTPAEASFIRGIEVGMAPNVDSDRSLVRPYQVADLVRLLTTGQLPGFEPHWWHRGCLAMTAMPLAAAMAFGHGIISWVRKTFRQKSVDRGALSPRTLRDNLKFLKWLIRTKNT